MMPARGEEAMTNQTHNATPPDPAVLVVVLNWRCADLTIGCLRSLREELAAMPRLRVCVVDNGSGDGSETKLRAAIPTLPHSERIGLLPAGRNGGFSAGNNVAIAPALAGEDKPDFVLLLNPDTLVRPAAIRTLVAFLQDHPRAGIAGSRMEYPDGTLQLSSFRFHSVLGELERGARVALLHRLLSRWAVSIELGDQPHEVDWVGGASMLIRREVFEQVGLLDEGYFLYYEETDFCLRARRAGWACWYVPSSVVTHLEGHTSGIVPNAAGRGRRARYWFESRHRYFRKNHGWATALLADVAWTVGLSIARVRDWVKRERNDPPWLLWDSIRYAMLLLIGVG